MMRLSQNIQRLRRRERHAVFESQLGKRRHQNLHGTVIPRHHQRIQFHEGSLAAHSEGVKVTPVIQMPVTAMQTAGKNLLTKKSATEEAPHAAFDEFTQPDAS